jgi:predicted dehydrogenase
MPQSRRRFLGLAAGIGAAAASPLVRASRALAEREPPRRKLGFALVGLGGLAGNQLAPAFEHSRLCRLAGLVSGHPDKARQWAQRYGVPEKSLYSYETFDRVADDLDVDVVYVVLPNSMHAEYTIRAARAGKHVLCEKPMAVSVKECDEMIAACKAANRLLAIGYRLHFEPFNLELARLAREKVFGEVKVIEASAGFRIGDPAQWRLDKRLSGGGSLMDIGIYALQAARYVSGAEPVSVSARAVVTDPAKFKDVDESILFELELSNGIVASCTSSYATNLSRFWAGAERGWFELSPALYYHGIRGRSAGSDGPKEMQFPDIDQFAAEMDDFAECILAGRQSRVSGEEGRRDLRIMTAIYESAASGRAVRL